MAELVSQTEFAEIAGRTYGAVNHSLRGGALNPAKVGYDVDRTHPAALAYIERAKLDVHPGRPSRKQRSNGAAAVAPLSFPLMGATPIAPAPTVAPISSTPPDAAYLDDAQQADERVRAMQRSLVRDGATPEELEDFPNKTILWLCERFRTNKDVLPLIASMARFEDMRNKRTLADNRRGEVLEREVVRLGVMTLLHALCESLITEMPDTLSRTLHPIYKRAADDVEVQAADAIRNTVSKYLTACQSAVADELEEGANDGID